MKHVTKGTPPVDFEAWKSQANEDWKPTYDDLQNPQKRNLHQALLDGGKGLPLPELSDEAAYLMQFFLEHFYLWFSCAYATQIRRYRQPWYDGQRQSPYHGTEPLDDPF